MREQAGPVTVREPVRAAELVVAPDRESAPAARRFEDEVLPYRPELYAAAMRLTRQRDDAQDLVQDTLMRAYTAWDRFVPGSNCRAWLLRILTNTFINTYRRRRRHRRFTSERPEEAVVALYGQERPDSPEEVLLGDTLGDEVTAALAGLGPEYRAVIELADLRGIRYREIARELAIPIGTVMSRLFRARRQLETQLSEYAASDYGIERAA